MTDNKRITKKDRFANLTELVESAEVNGLIDAAEATDHREFIAHEVELLTKKANGPKGKTKEQVANDKVKADMVALLTESGEAMKSSEVAASLGISVQKSTSLLTQLVKGEVVTREKDGKDTWFSVA